MRALDRFFHIRERGSTIQNEVMGGLTTFFAMCYLIVMIPSTLSAAGMDYHAVMASTCLCAAVGSILTGLLANVPFAQAPGLGFNILLVYTICQRYGYTWQQGLALVFISGVLFLLLSLSPLRQKILDAIPMPFKFALSAGVGLLITLSGLISAGIVTAQGNLLDMGAIISPGPLLALLGVFLTAALILRKIPGAVMIGMIAITVLGIPFGITVLPDSLTAPADLSPVFLKLDFSGILTPGILPPLSALLSLLFADCFDTVGTLLGIAGNAKMTDNTGDFPGQGRAVIADAIATCVGALCGVANVTTTADSAVGIREGARTGLCPIVTGLLFLLAIPFAPLLGAIPDTATAAAVIIVGMMMMSGISQITWKHIEISLPCFLIVVGMPFTFSITSGIALGCISYVVLMVCRKRGALVDPWMYVLAGVFFLMILLSAVV